MLSSNLNSGWISEKQFIKKAVVNQIKFAKKYVRSIRGKFQPEKLSKKVWTELFPDIKKNISRSYKKGFHGDSPYSDNFIDHKNFMQVCFWKYVEYFELLVVLGVFDY